MSGRWVLRAVCAVIGHGQLFWHVRSRGSGWECSRCLRFKPSPVLQAVRRA